MPSAPSKGLPPGYDVPLWAPSSSSGWTGPRVVLPPKAGVPVAPPRVVLPSEARVVLPPKAAALVPTQPLLPPPHLVTQISESDSDDVCYDSSGRLMVDKGAGRSSLAPSKSTPTSKRDRTVNDIVDALVTPMVDPTWSLARPKVEDSPPTQFAEFDDFYEQELAPPPEVKVEPKVETKVEIKMEEDSKLFAMMSPRVKAPPPHRIKAEVNEAPARFAKRLRAVKEEVQDEDGASASASSAAAVHYTLASAQGQRGDRTSQPKRDHIMTYTQNNPK